MFAAPQCAYAQLLVPGPGDGDSCLLLSRVPTPPIPLDDITGDGIADWAQSIRGTAQDAGFVLIVSGASGATVQQIPAPPQFQAFGVGVFAASAGTAGAGYDLAIVSVDELGQPVVSLYDTASGLAAATIHLVPTAGSDIISILAMGDVDGDGFITVDDLAATVQFWAAGTTGPAVEQADFDGDGLVSEADVWEVATRLGCTVEDVASGDFAGTLQGTLLLADPGVDGEGGSNYSLGCLWCSIKCGAHLVKAADCVNSLPCPWDSCLAQYPDSASEEFVECFRTARFNGITKCLKDTADAAGTCGSCVYKCGPKPS